MIPQIHIEDYNYPLPDERIAKYPLPERDASKLLHYSGGVVEDHCFRELPSLLPQGALMVFNDTKVVPARLHFQRESGAHIEVFVLEPLQPAEYVSAFAATESCVWKCVIGNAKRWKGGLIGLYGDNQLGLKAELLNRDGATGS
ncbi:MAG: S-adenosylmethionine:tRNA ribosyltransferase-isomerase, partial [Bacteroidales bacterium]|nr:S-adenosylmethionine:tRNA ribosyltransferase-isomerase [Bacteroidales bacterium]